MESESPVKIKREVLNKAIEGVLDTAKVPMRYHLKVVEKLHKALQDNTKQNEGHEKVVAEHTQEVAAIHKHYQEELQALGSKVDEANSNHTTQVGEYQQEIERLRTIQKGEDGEDGEDAPPVDEGAIVSRVLSMVPPPEKGDKGDKGDTLAMEEIIATVIKRIQKGDVIHINNVKGAGGFIKDGIRYRFEELMHGSGSGSGPSATFVDNEIVSGTGTAWTLANTPVAGSVQLYGNGQYLTPGAGNDYTISGKNITTTNSFTTGTIVAFYRK